MNNRNQSKFSQRISIPIGILIIVSFAVSVGKAVVWQWTKTEIEKKNLIKKEELPEMKETYFTLFPQRPEFNPPLDWHSLETNQVYYENYFKDYISAIVNWLSEAPANKDYLVEFVTRESKRTKENFFEKWQISEENLDDDIEKEISIVVSVTAKESKGDISEEWKELFVIDIKDNKYFPVFFPKKPRFNPPNDDFLKYSESYFKDYINIILDWLNKFSINRSYLSLFLSQEEEEGFDNDGYFPEEWELFEEDLDNDKEKEIIIAVSRIIGFGGAIGKLFIIDLENNRYFLFTEFKATRLDIERIADINRDNWKEILLFEYWCGASTCEIDVSILRYDSEEKIYKYLLKEISVSGIDSEEAKKEGVKIEDLDNDGILEITTKGAYRARGRTDIYKWNGENYVHFKRIWDPPNLFIDAICDAKEAFSKKNYQEAIEIYKKIIYEQPYKTGAEVTLREKEEVEKERQYLAAFGRFKLILIYLLQKNENQAKIILEEIKREEPESIYTIFSQIVWENYQKRRDIINICKEIREYIGKDSQVKEDFYKYFNRGYYYDLPCDWKIEDICP